MSYDVNQIIPISVAISPQGLGFANFASAVLFAPATELPSGFAVETRRDYTSLPALAVDFPATTETYKAASKWLGGTPAGKSLTVYAVNGSDTSWTDTLNKARNQFWWFFSFFTKDVYADTDTAVPAIATWCDANESFFINCQTDTACTAIRDPNVTNDIASTLTDAGYRLTETFAHASDPYAGIAYVKWFAAVNYSAVGSTITGEYKKLTGVVAEDLTATEYNTMKAKKATYYTKVDLQGSVDAGRVLNSVTHSSYGEYTDDVINLAAFVNGLKVNLFNSVANQPKKLGQDPQGQAVVIGSAREICQTYVNNNYLGPRNYTDPDDGQDKYTAGYEILTQPDEILNLLEPDRDARKAAPLRVRIFRRGAIHSAPVDVSVY